MRTIKGVRCTDAQADVYDVLKAHGPLADVALVPLAQHMLNVHQSSSGIRTRRSELVRKRLVRPDGTRVRTGSGRWSKAYRVR